MTFYFLFYDYLSSGLLQSTAEHLEMYLDEVREQIDHGRSEETRHSWRRGLRHGRLELETDQRRNGGIVFYCLYRSEIKVQLNTNKTLYSGMLLTIFSSLTTSS